VDVLLQLECWLKDEQDHHVFWLNGLAGTGKSTIAQTFAQICFADGNLGASFFCSRDFEDRSNLQIIFPTLAFQLAYKYSLFREQLLRVLRANPGVGQESLCSQMEKVIVGPLKATNIQTLIIIDALDECRDEEPASAILSVLSRYVDGIPKVKFFITGRPESRIRNGFRLKSLRPITEVLRLHDVERSLVDSDIKLFLKTELTNIAETWSDCDLTEDWPSSDKIKILCEKAAGLFIYASTVVKFVASKYHTPAKRLTLITSLPQSTTHEGKSGIDLLYTQVLGQAFHDADLDEQELYSCFRSVVGTVLLVFNPLPMDALSTLLRASDISTALRPLHSLLLVPDNKANPIRVFHKSFPDFLMDQRRCKDERFFVSPPVHHQDIMLSCLNLMEEKLKRNICELDNYAILTQVADLSVRRKNYIGDALEYSCQFWAKHLTKVSSSGHDAEEVHKAVDKFFTTHLLFWIEVLAIMGSLGVGVYAINDVQQWYSSVSCEQLIHWSWYLYYVQGGLICQWANDSQRLILESFDTIHNSPSKIYHEAIPFSPSSSWLHKYYNTELLQGFKVVKGLQAKWGTCSRTVAIEGIPCALACWNNLIATGLTSGDIITLDAVTGIYTSILLGHAHCVKSLTFSSDGKFLVSGSSDKTINLWDVQTGGIVKAFHGHTDEVCSVSISMDDTMVASGSRDKTIRLWDTQTGECCHIIDNLSDYVSSVTFSPTNPQLLMSGSGDNTIQQWDTKGHQIGPPYEGSYVSFSPDGTCFVMWGGVWGEEEFATIRNSNSGVVITTVRVPGGDIKCCCFSPDGRFMAGASGRTSYVWDITGSKPCLIETCVEHTRIINALAFYSSLISSSSDGSIKFWQVGTPSVDPVATDPGHVLSTPASIMSISLQAKDGIAISCDEAGVVRTWDTLTGLCKASTHTSVGFPDKIDMRLVNNRLISGCYGPKVDYGHKSYTHSRVMIDIWDTKEEKHLQRTDAFPGFVAKDLRISGDGAKVFLLGGKCVQALSTWTGEIVGEVRLGDQLFNDHLIVDGSRVWVQTSGSPIQGWDFGTLGSTPISLSNMPPGRPYLDFLDGNNGWDIRGPRIKDTVTGEEVYRLPKRFRGFTAAEWDGRYLVTGYGSGEVMILDFDCLASQQAHSVDIL